MIYQNFQAYSDMAGPMLRDIMDAVHKKPADRFLSTVGGDDQPE
jgi:hypothetical protein